MDDNSLEKKDLSFYAKNGDSSPIIADETEQNRHYLQTIPIIKQIVSYKLNKNYRDAIEDVTQRVLLKLWKWKSKEKRSLSSEEWGKLANVASQNEVKDFYTQKFHREVSLNNDVADNHNLEIQEKLISVEGNTESETKSLLNLVWKNVPKLSLRQRFAVLLAQDFIIYLISYRCCRISDLAEILHISIDEMNEIIISLPLSDVEIGKIMSKVLNEEVSQQKLWEARSKGKIKLLSELKRIEK